VISLAKVSCEHDDLQDLQDPQDDSGEEEGNESTLLTTRKQRRSMPTPRLWSGDCDAGDYDADGNEEKEEERTAVSTLLLPPSSPVALPTPPFTVEGGNLFGDLMDMFSDEVDTKVGKSDSHLMSEKKITFLLNNVL
jgi:hypothetical protein